MNFLRLANQSFCKGGGEGGSGLSQRPPSTAAQLPPQPQTYQAHAGFDAVEIDAGNHLEGDLVLAGLHVIHLPAGRGRRR